MSDNLLEQIKWTAGYHGFYVSFLSQSWLLNNGSMSYRLSKQANGLLKEILLSERKSVELTRRRVCNESMNFMRNFPWFARSHLKISIYTLYVAFVSMGKY